MMKAGDKVRFREAGIPGAMVGEVMDVDMGYVIVEGPDGKRRLRCIRDVETVGAGAAGKVRKFKIIG